MTTPAQSTPDQPDFTRSAIWKALGLVYCPQKPGKAQIARTGVIPEQDFPLGVSVKVMGHTRDCNVFQVDLFEGGQIPEHWHVQEQFGFVTRGRIEVNLDGEREIIEEGCGYFVESGIKHGLIALQPSKVIEVYGANLTSASYASS